MHFQCIQNALQRCFHYAQFSQIGSHLSNWKKRPKKYQGVNGIRSCALHDTGAMSCEATHLERGQFVEFMSSRAVKRCEIYIKCILYCGCRWKWGVIITINFQFKQLEGRSLKNIRASMGFEPVTSTIPVRCSTNWAVKPHIGSEVNLLSSCLPVRWNDVKYIWNAYCTVAVDENEEWSLQ